LLTKFFGDFHNAAMLKALRQAEKRPVIFSRLKSLLVTGKPLPKFDPFT
jgi:hypothetical protein